MAEFQEQKTGIKKNRLLGSLLLILTAVIWGTAFVFQRSGMELIEPITFNASRMTLAAIAVGLTAVFLRKKPAQNPAESGPAAAGKSAAAGEPAAAGRKLSGARLTVIGGICCGAFLAAGSLFQQMGIVYTTAGKAGFITALYILLVPIISFILFRKRGTWLVWLAVLLGVVGLYLLCMTESFRLAKGDALICICAVMFSGHILCCGYFAAKADPVRISAIQFVTAALISWCAAFLAEAPSWEKILSAALPIVYCGVISGGLGYTLQMVAQKHTDPTVASLLMSLEAVFAVIAGALILHEQMSGRELLGCVIMFAAIVLVQIPLPRKKKDSG